MSLNGVAPFPASSLPYHIIHTDGASRGNPGHAGIGFTIHDSNGNLSASHASYIGIATNNVAEYSALIAALKEAERLGVERIEVISDSLLMVHQMNGDYKVKDAGLIPLHAEATALLRRFKSASVRHTLRGGNSDADRLASGAITAHLKPPKAKKSKKATAEQPALLPADGNSAAASSVVASVSMKEPAGRKTPLTDAERERLLAVIASMKEVLAELEALLSDLDADGS